LRNAAGLLILIVAVSPTLVAQWPSYPSRGVPKTPDGKPDLTGPTPRLADGKPDFSPSLGPEQPPLHAAGDDQRLPGNVAGYFTRRKEPGSMRDIARLTALPQCIWCRDFLKTCRIFKLRCISRSDSPAGADAIPSTATIIACGRR